MSETQIEFIHSARRLSGREEFHRHLFESMLGGRWRRQAVSLPPADAAALLELLSRWIREAPVKDELGVLRLLVVRRVIHSLVLATGTSVRRFVMDVLASSEQDLLHPQQMPGWKQSKLAALADGSLLSVEALGEWNAQDPATARLAAIACLDACPLDAGVAQNTGDIGRWLMSVPPVKLPVRYLEQLQNSAFFVSYLADPDRHAFKRAIVRQAGFMLQGLPLPVLCPAGASAGSPVRLTIVGELLFPQHAMFRCYGDLLAGLKEHFHVTLVADEPTRCAEHGQLSHEQKYFPSHEREVARLAQLVASTAPDIILYPSIGMSYWTFVLSMLRLAPLQLMSVGHPAPSCSEHIDGTLVYGELAAAPMPEYGNLISFDNQALPAPPPDGWQTQLAPAGDKLIIAVNAARMKLTPQFLALVAAALESAPQGTELHFFPNATGVELLALRQGLKAQFPLAYVHPTMNYSEYMGLLSKAAVILQSFPFGGTNTAMDALALGIPLVCLDGDDLAAKVDPLLLRRAGLAELCASSPADYLAITTRLLNSSQERDRIREVAKAGLATLKAQDPLGQTTMADAVLRAWQARATGTAPVTGKA
jgi:hypothetical protein